MSGGSFNYLYSKDLDEVMGCLSSLNDMADELDASFSGTRAARDTRVLISRINEAFTTWGSEQMKALRDVWHDIEWWTSMDYSRDKAQAAVDNYRGNHNGLLSWAPMSGNATHDKETG
ncbi:Uncharacterised protein [Mycobacteroides abscessus subsp. abscessus]|uniref:hypothetical protein n=1 Tax=Mycobacteroides abscessus TaxID=36809 RepID=UPI0009C4D7A4|nr:hypothetical protein [Mycobacteroides abscessus]SLJ40699.1 Uncharacterised protein [Mycobacteroides abscessus subsp. abscessus]